MNKKLKKALEISFVVLTLAMSVAIFVFRNKIGAVGNVGYLGLFALCFAANATVLLPAPSLMIAASCALIMNPLLVALFAALGSTLGELVGYAFGVVSEDLSPRFKKILDKLTAKIKNEALLVFVLAALPLPLFDVAGIYSGGTRMKPVKFFIACFLGKLVKLLVYTRMYDIIAWLNKYSKLKI